MAVAAYLLVVFDHERGRNTAGGAALPGRDAHRHAGALSDVCSLGQRQRAISRSPRWLHGSQPAPGSVAAVLTLALVGFGLKAGLVPLHVWLPPAHAAAPSHVSALMSGVVIKMGIYGLLRVVALIGSPPAWWGWLILAGGVASGVLGVIWALAQHDLKRLLAFHSVENIGIILLGMGAGCPRSGLPSADGRAVRIWRRGAAHSQPCSLQEPPLPRCRRRSTARHGDTPDRPTGRPGASDAARPRRRF